MSGDRTFTFRSAEKRASLSNATKYVPDLPAVIVLTPTLILLGVSVVGVLSISLGIVMSSVATSYVFGSHFRRRADGVLTFSLGISLMALITGVAGPQVAVVTLLVTVLICLVVWGRRRVEDPLTDCFQGIIPGDEYASTFRTYVWFPVILVTQGWQSLSFFAISVLVSKALWRHRRDATWKLFTLLVSAIGFGVSLWQLDGGRGQFWVSVDQLYRSTIASGVTSWGYSDFSGATGGILRYHWLGEASAGVISKFPQILAVESVTVVTPTLGILVSLTCLVRLGRKFAFDDQSVLVASVTALILNREFDVYSVGSLWGISLFLLGLLFVADLVDQQSNSSRARWATVALAVLVTPLIALSQSTLGASFVLLSMTVALFATLKKFLNPFRAGLMVSGQVLSLFILRATLLSSETTNIYDPTISLSNVLQFRGIELYLGENRLYVAGVSILFLLVVLQKGSGILLARRSDFDKTTLLLLLGATTVSSLVLANAFSIGGVESHQSRFLSPLVVIVGFCSFLFLSKELRDSWKSLGGRIIARFAALLVVIVTVVLSAAGTQLYESAWSRERTAGIGIFIGLCQILAVALWWFSLRSRRSAGTSHFLVVLALTGVVITANARTFAYLAEYQLTARDVDRDYEFTGGEGGLDCLDFVRNRTDKDAIVASNWFRIGSPSRLPKNYLVSAWTERRLYLDGPLYIRTSVDSPKEDSNTEIDWIDFRYQMTDDFAERATPESYGALRAKEVEYFVADTARPMPATWEPYAEVIFEREPCKVLKLRTED